MARKKMTDKVRSFIPVMIVVCLILSGICICRTHPAPARCPDCCSNDCRSKTEQTSEGCACFVCGLNTFPMVVPVVSNEAGFVRMEQKSPDMDNTFFTCASLTMHYHLTVISVARCLDDLDRFRAVHLESTVIRI